MNVLYVLNMYVLNLFFPLLTDAEHYGLEQEL